LVTIGEESLEVGEVRSSFHIGDILMYMEDQSPYDLKVKTKSCHLFALAKSDFAELKMSFKDSISKILVNSHKDYCRIEAIRTFAADFHSKNNTFIGFQVKKAELKRRVLFSNTEFGHMTMDRMSFITHTIASERKLDMFLKSRQSIADELVKKYLSNEDLKLPSSSDIDLLDDIGTRIAKESQKVEKHLVQNNPSNNAGSSNLTLETIPEVRDDSIVMMSRNQSPLSTLSPLKQPKRVQFSTENENCMKSFEDVTRSGINTMIQEPKPKPQQRSSFCKQSTVNNVYNKIKSSDDMINRNQFMSVLNEKIYEDVMLNRNKEIMNEKLIKFIGNKNSKVAEKQVKSLDKIFVKLNQLLVLNLRKLRDELKTDK
jgi:hypothetical protein